MRYCSSNLVHSNFQRHRNLLYRINNEPHYHSHCSTKRNFRQTHSKISHRGTASSEKTWMSYQNLLLLPFYFPYSRMFANELYITTILPASFPTYAVKYVQNTSVRSSRQFWIRIRPLNHSRGARCAFRVFANLYSAYTLTHIMKYPTRVAKSSTKTFQREELQRGEENKHRLDFQLRLIEPLGQITKIIYSICTVH